MQNFLLRIIFILVIVSINSSYTYALDDQSDCADKKVIKAVEKVVIIGTKTEKAIKARIDTGATHSSIDKNLASLLGYTKVIRQARIRNAQGEVIRPVVKFRFILKGRKCESFFSLADRKKLNYLVLIGREDLDGFLVDPHDD